MTPAPTLERLWLVYLAAVASIALFGLGHGVPAAAVAGHLAVHAVVLVAVLLVRWRAVHRSHDAVRAWRPLMALLCLPAVFSAMGWLLPAVHPQPFEYTWLEVDRAVFGNDVLRLVDGWLAPWCVEVLQLVYAAFYVLPIAAALCALRSSGREAFDRAVLLLVGGFLMSYLGYLLWPTLGPKVVFNHAPALDGLWFTDALRHSIDAAELNEWDCFPSGHTMLTITSLIVAWRWHRRCFVVLLPIGLLLIASTVLLRYHWVTDVVVGALLAWPCARLCDHLADRDGWPAAAVPSTRPA